MEFVSLGQSTISEADFERLINEYRGNYTALAAHLGCHRSTVSKAAKRLGLTPTMESDALAKADMRIARLEAERKSLAERNRSLARRANFSSDVNRLLDDFVSRNKLPKLGNNISVPVPSNSGGVSFVAPITDWHFGENVESQSIEGLNEYNTDICAGRVKKVVDEIIWYGYQNGTVDELVIPVMGDMFNGMHLIHPEIAEDYAFAVRQGLDSALLLAQAVYELAQVFPRIRMVFPAGDNHTRLTRRPPTGVANQECSLSTWYYDTVCNLLVNLDNVSFEMPRSYKATFKVQGRNWVAMHGHFIKGGGGKIGVPANKAVDIYQVIQGKSFEKFAISGDVGDVNIDTFLIGHFHTDATIDCNTGVVRFLPSIKGPDGFSNDVLEKTSKAASRLFVVDENGDTIGEHKIFVNGINAENFEHNYSMIALESEKPTGLIMRDWVNTQKEDEDVSN